MMYPMWPYDGFIDTTDRALRAGEWSDALTRALWRKDAAAARELFDHTFWHKTDFKPDWFHLYVAVQQGERELVQLMVTHGARWDAAQTAIAAKSFGEKIKPFKYVLAAGGMHIDAPFDLAKIDALTAVSMDRRILSENEKYGGVKPEDVRAFNLAVSELCLRAAMRGDAAQAKKIYTHHTESAQGLDITPLLQARAKLALLSFGAAEITAMTDALKAAGVPLKPVALDTLPDMTQEFYTLVPALEERGLLGGDLARLRDKIWRSWCHAQEELAPAVDIQLRIPPEIVQRMRKDFTAAAEVLCRQNSDLSPEEARGFVALHERQAARHPDAVTHMDETLMAGGFFGNTAFDPESLKRLAQAAPTEGLRDAFNRYAAGRVIEDHGLHHYLRPKRFGVLLEALQSKAYKPSPEETRDIVTYLYERCTRRGVPEDVTAAMIALRDCGANFILVDPLRYMGSKHPLLAQTMLDLDIIRAKNIKVHRLVRQISPHQGMGGIHAKPEDSDYARREFLYQVLFERSYPDKTAEYRAKKGISYQRIYTLRQLSDAMDGIRLHQARPKPLPRSKFPPVRPPLFPAPPKPSKPPGPPKGPYGPKP